jgi:hypothetical protein|tara:strand:+ start:1274 stop:1576 length:303 start_codon:yes stop_codon:yes gene_type:complete
MESKKGKSKLKTKLTIADIKRNNKESGHHFFDKFTMRIFNSRIETGLYKDNTFITSEQFDVERVYTIRRALDGGVKIERIGELGQFKTLEDAKEGRKKLK